VEATAAVCRRQKRGRLFPVACGAWILQVALLCRVARAAYVRWASRQVPWWWRNYPTCCQTPLPFLFPPKTP